MTKSQSFKFDTKPSDISGKGAFPRNLFCRNKPNFNTSNITATSYSTVGYNAFQRITKNGTNPNKANPKPISNTTKPSLFSGGSWVFKNTFSGKQTQFPESENPYNYLQKRYLQRFTPPNQQKKQTQSKPKANPIKANFKNP